jgi:hypothetical protein
VVFALKYACSLLQTDQSRCYLCGRRDQHLDRHEIFGGSNRRKSAAMGLWVVLCHDRCHLNGVHKDGALMRMLRAKGQQAAMERYGMTKEEFIREYGKSYI